MLVELIAFAVEGRFMNENRQKNEKLNVKDMPLIRYLNYLAKIREVMIERKI